MLHVGEKTECQLRNLVSTQFLSRRAVNETRAVSFRWAVSFSQGRVESNSTVSAISAMPSNSRWTTVEFHQCQTAYGFSWRLARLVMCILFTAPELACKFSDTFQTTGLSASFHFFYGYNGREVVALQLLSPFQLLFDIFSLTVDQDQEFRQFTFAVLSSGFQ